MPWTYIINDLNGEQIIGTFYEKELQKKVNKNLELKKYLKEKVINYTSNGKVMIVHLLAGLIRKILYKNESIFSKTI